MIKQLLATAAIAAMALGASAEKTVLWTAESPEGTPFEGWHDFLVLSAEQTAVLNAGDILSVTITAKGQEGWPQVGLFEGNVGWPPLTSAGAGEMPNTVNLAVSYDIAQKIHANGATIKGESVYVSEISYEKSAVEVGPNTVWFGPKQCAWGDAVSIPADVFADVKAGDQIKVNYDTAAPEHTLQFIMGGWSGLNIATYQAGALDCMTIDEETGWITLELAPELANLVWGEDEKEYDAFALLKEGGLILQGPCLVNKVDFIPASEEETPSVNYYAVGGFQGWDPENPAVFTFADGVYTLVAENASAMKISTAKGDWDTFNAATIAPAAEEGKFEVKADFQFALEYEATWTVTIDHKNQTIKFTTDDPKPAVTDIYIRGGMNNWEAVDAWKMNTTDGNIYTLEGVSISSDIQFKIADATWGSVDYGTSAPIAPNTAAVLDFQGKNITLTESVENAIVEFNLTDKTLKVSTGNSVSAIEGENAAVYYNLQGVKVANPTEGNVYIVKKGTKVSKVAF